jgi:hypothetical protein
MKVSTIAFALTALWTGAAAQLLYAGLPSCAVRVFQSLAAIPDSEDIYILTIIIITSVEQWSNFENIIAILRSTPILLQPT